MFPLGNAPRATRCLSSGIGAISCGWSDIAILLGSKDGDQTPSLQTLLASGLCEIPLRCLMMPHEIGIGPRLMSCKSEFASSIRTARLRADRPPNVGAHDLPALGARRGPLGAKQVRAARTTPPWDLMAGRITATCSSC